MYEWNLNTKVKVFQHPCLNTCTYFLVSIFFLGYNDYRKTPESIFDHRAWFDKVAVLRTATFLKRDSNSGVIQRIFDCFKKTLFIEHLWWRVTSYWWSYIDNEQQQQQQQQRITTSCRYKKIRQELILKSNITSNLWFLLFPILISLDL